VIKASAPGLNTWAEVFFNQPLWVCLAIAATVMVDAIAKQTLLTLKDNMRENCHGYFTIQN
jgi:hypothetical protein